MQIDSDGVVKGKINLEQFGKQAEKTEKQTKGLDDVLRALSPSALAGVAGITALIGAFKGLTDSVRSSMRVYSEFETMQKGLETFYQSAERGKAVFEDLRRLSNETTFGVDELANSATQLLNVGVAGSQLNETLITLGNIAQGDKAKFAELTSIYAKINSTGKATSIQLQQLAMRGIPIYDQLKKIGVTGTASLEDIEQVMKNLTEEGGQFYNAMNNINDTIEGKEGFIRDYFREFQANFIEASGLAEVYKKVLDSILPIISAMSDALVKINENPVLKALLSGAIATMIGGLVGAIVGGLIPALTTVASLMSAINPTALIGLLAGLGVGVAGGIATGVISYNNAEEKLNDTLLQSNKELEKLNSVIRTDGYKGLLNNQIEEKRSILDTLDSRENAIYKKKRLNEGDNSTLYDIQNARSQTEKDIESLKEQLKIVKKNDSFDKIFNGYFSELKANSPLAQIEQYNDEIKKLTEFMNTGKRERISEDKNGNLMVEYTKLTTKEQAEIKEVIKHIQGKVDELQPKMENGSSLTEDFSLLQAIQDFPSYLEQGFSGLLSGTGLDSIIALDPIGVATKLVETFVKLIGEINSVQTLLNAFEELLEPIVKVLTPLIDSVLNPINELIKTIGETIAQIIAPLSNALIPIINALLIPIKLLSSVLKIVGGAFEWLNDKIIVPVGNAIIDGLNVVIEAINGFLSLFTTNRVQKFDRLLTTSEMLADAQEDELAKLQKLNDAFEELKDAILKQEDYYLRTKTQLNADMYNTKVNDMILTPQGNFSTHPDDYIIATKNPNALGGGFNVQINNTVSDSVQATASRDIDENGIERLVVQISRKVAQDVADGANGWDSALSIRNLRLAGRGGY